MMLLIFALFLASCADTSSNLCEEWTWIDEEHCAMDVCAEDGAEYSECINGECWCCIDEECWKE